MADLAWLLDDWAELVGPGDSATRVGRDLLARWTEPHRRYHTQDHLTAVLRHLRELTSDGGGQAAVRLAAWYHDAIYQPEQTDNEAQSAELAQLDLSRLSMESAITAEVMRLVRLTGSHQPAASDSNGAVLCDADLAVLAGPIEEYQRYAEAVRLEYRHLDEATWRAGRTEVLGQLLGQAWLFHTEFGRHHWEAPARENIKGELAEMARLSDFGSRAAAADRPTEA
jgi:predicted metal-dependent HD superfamily phosphohydrolase